MKTTMNFKMNIRKQMAGLSIAILALLYQNFEFIDCLKVSLTPIDEQTRSAHARELLGKYYEGSSAQKASGLESGLSTAIYNDVYASLSEKYRKKSASLASTIIEQTPMALQRVTAHLH